MRCAIWETITGDSAALADGAILLSTARGAAGVMDTVKERWAAGALEGS
jgi:hypothetical protein